METWGMVNAKRARTAERPKQPSTYLNLRAPCFYPDLNLGLVHQSAAPLLSGLRVIRRVRGCVAECGVWQERQAFWPTLG